MPKSPSPDLMEEDQLDMTNDEDNDDDNVNNDENEQKIEDQLVQ